MARSRVVAAKQFGMDEIDRADVERRRDAHAALQRDEAFDEVEARATQIKTAVDMRGLDVQESRGVDRLRETDEQSHRESRCLAMDAREEGLVEGGEVEGHLVRLAWQAGRGLGHRRVTTKIKGDQTSFLRAAVPRSYS